MTDRELMGQYVEAASQQAFEQLVRRHGGWVYGCARRRVRDAHSAEDVAQAVFILLSQNARKVGGNERLAAWLFKATHFCSANAIKQQARRQKHEREAAMQQMAAADAAGNWEEIWPVLDEAVAKLGAADREAILLRFYQGMSLSELAGAIGTGEEAATKRVQRAVEKLRGVLAKKGVVAGAAALGVVMAEKVTAAAPAGLVEAAMAAATGGGTGSAGVIAKGAMKMMAWAKVKVAVGLALAALVAAGAGIAVSTTASEPPAGKPATQPATMTVAELAEGQVVAETKERAFIDGRTVLKSWQGIYGSLLSMKVRYCKHLILPVGARPSDGMGGSLVIWDYVDRVEEGLKYHIYSSSSPERAGALESAFDGVVTAEYDPSTSQGTVERGLNDKHYKDMNELALVMLVYPGGPLPTQLSLMASLPDAKIRVLPQLATLIDQPCHVLELGDLATTGYCSRIWFAHERGMLPLKFESIREGKVAVTIAVQEIKSVETRTGRIWYPARATRTFLSQRGIPIEYELTVQEFVPNIATDANTFRVIFPHGAHVGDFVAQSDYVVGGDDPSGRTRVHAMATAPPTTAPSSGIVPGAPILSAETRAPVKTSKAVSGASGVAFWQGAEWLSLMVLLAAAVGGLWWMRRAKKKS